MGYGRGANGQKADLPPLYIYTVNMRGDKEKKQRRKGEGGGG